MGTWDTQGGWVDRLKQYFHTEYFQGQRKVQVYNLGIGGELSSGLHARIENEIKARLNPNWEPIVVIGTGKNDSRAKKSVSNFESSPEDYEMNLKHCIEIASIYTNRILLVGLGLVDESRRFKDLFYQNERMELFDKVNMKVAHDLNVRRVDIQKEMQTVPNLSSWFVDGVHPNHVGYQWIYERILPEILKLLG